MQYNVKEGYIIKNHTSDTSRDYNYIFFLFVFLLFFFFSLLFYVNTDTDTEPRADNARVYVDGKIV